MERIKKITPYQDINDLLDFLARGIQNIFGRDLVGFYLTGSLSYDDFNEGRSDIDLAVILNTPVTDAQIDLLKLLHLDTEKKYEKWAKRIECSYIPLDILRKILPPDMPRPYVGGGNFYPKALYGNEWIINKHFLYKYGIALLGPDFKILSEPVDIKDLREACIRDLHQEWKPKIFDQTYLKDDHQQSYLILNLCRIMYTIMCNDAVSKKIASDWAKTRYPRWKELIKAAEEWHYELSMQRDNETIDFIKFTLSEVRE